MCRRLAAAVLSSPTVQKDVHDAVAADRHDAVQARATPAAASDRCCSAVRNGNAAMSSLSRAGVVWRDSPAAACTTGAKELESLFWAVRASLVTKAMPFWSDCQCPVPPPPNTVIAR
jgi:hypothetical protein